MHHQAKRRLPALVLLGVLLGLAGCGSIYHEVARREPGSLEQRLDLRQSEAVELHARTLDAIELIVSDLRETRRTRTRAGRIERLRTERIDAGQLAWRARKSIASIEDVIVLDREGGIEPGDADGAAQRMTLLERASDEIDSALELIEGAVEAYVNGDPVGVDAIDDHATRARALVDQSG
mgnify:CR=1 FL=1